MIGQNLLTQKNILWKWSLNTSHFVKYQFVGLYILCVKMKTFLCEESLLCHNQKNYFSSYLDHYLKVMDLTICYICSHKKLSTVLFCNYSIILYKAIQLLLICFNKNK